MGKGEQKDNLFKLGGRRGEEKQQTYSGGRKRSGNSKIWEGRGKSTQY